MFQCFPRFSIAAGQTALGFFGLVMLYVQCKSDGFALLFGVSLFLLVRFELLLLSDGFYCLLRSIGAWVLGRVWCIYIYFLVGKEIEIVKLYFVYFI